MAKFDCDHTCSGLNIGRADAIEAFEDSYTEMGRWASETGSKLSGKPACEPVLHCDMLVQVIGGELPYWARKEPSLPASALWHFLIVRDLADLQHMQADWLDLCSTRFRVIILSTDHEVDVSILRTAHWVIRCILEDIDHVAEAFAHFVLRHGFIGKDTADLIKYTGMQTTSTVSGVAFLFPGKGTEAASLFQAVRSLAEKNIQNPASGCMCQFFSADVDINYQIIPIVQDTYDFSQKILDYVNVDYTLGGIVGYPRTEALLILFHSPDSGEF
ncbi:MAG: hypothetical protein ABII76_13600 [Pseudomonadota bacterium]